MVMSETGGMGAPMNSVRTQVTGITGKEQLMDVCGVVFVSFGDARDGPIKRLNGTILNIIL